MYNRGSFFSYYALIDSHQKSKVPEGVEEHHGQVDGAVLPVLHGDVDELVPALQPVEELLLGILGAAPEFGVQQVLTILRVEPFGGGRKYLMWDAYEDWQAAELFTLSFG